MKEIQTLKSPTLGLWLETSLKNKNNKKQFTIKYATQQKSNVKMIIGGFGGKIIEPNKPSVITGMEMKLRYDKIDKQWDIDIEEEHLNYIVIASATNKLKGEVNYLSLMEPNYFKDLKTQKKLVDPKTGKVL